jgi:hypothetical protein
MVNGKRMTARKDRMCSFCGDTILKGTDYIAIGAYADYCLKHGQRRMAGIPKEQLDMPDV